MTGTLTKSQRRLSFREKRVVAVSEAYKRVIVFSEDFCPQAQLLHLAIEAMIPGEITLRPYHVEELAEAAEDCPQPACVIVSHGESWGQDKTLSLAKEIEKRFFDPPTIWLHEDDAMESYLNPHPYRILFNLTHSLGNKLQFFNDFVLHLSNFI